MSAEYDQTLDEAQEAMENEDFVTASELQEMYPDKNMNNIENDMARDQSELELNAKRQERYEFNEPRMAARQGRKTYHSGPKGVLTDFEEAKLKWRAIDIDRDIKKERKLYMNLDNSANETASTLTIVEHKAQNSDEDDIDIVDDDDDEALLRYKLQKMRILEENRPRFGDTKEVTAWTFDKEVDEAPHNVMVVIHVYQDYLKRCGRMNHAIAQIAKAYPNIKFLRARSDRLGLDTYPEIGLPTFIIFKNGKQIQNHIAVHHFISNPFTVKDVERFLIEKNVIQPIIVIPSAAEEQKTQTIKKTNVTVSNNNMAYSNKASVDDDSDSSGLDID